MPTGAATSSTSSAATTNASAICTSRAWTPVVRERVEREGIPFAKAVELDMFVEPERGVLDFRAVRDALDDVGYDGYAIVEQDLYPTPFDRPLPIARRTRAYLRDIGIG